MTSVLAPTSPRTVNARNPGGELSPETLVELAVAGGMRRRDACRLVDHCQSIGNDQEELLERILSYSDPTGNTAVNNVVHQGTVKRR